MKRLFRQLCKGVKWIGLTRGLTALGLFIVWLKSCCVICDGGSVGIRARIAVSISGMKSAL